MPMLAASRRRLSSVALGAEHTQNIFRVLGEFCVPDLYHVQFFAKAGKPEVKMEIPVKTIRSLTANATLILLLLTLARSSRRLLIDSLHALSRPEGDEVSAYERRFEEIKPLLPTHGRVCYLDDNTGSVEEIAQYYQAQYALSPRLVVRGTDCRLVIVNSSNGHVSGPSSPAKPIFMLVHDYGAGLALWERRLEAAK
jgi:hypothetical protein